MIAALCLVSLIRPPTQLSRTFLPKEKSAYTVQSTLKLESRVQGLETWMPSDVNLSYGFTTEVMEVRPEGVAVLRYKRPTFTQTLDDGETPLPRKTVSKPNLEIQVTLSPLNRVLELKDMTQRVKFAHPNALAMSPVQDPIGAFVSDIYRLAAFSGSFESSLDIQPPLPLTPPSVGDTWKTTVSFQPQRLKGKDGKQAVQRLDYTYTYKGMVKAKSGQVQRIVADLDLSTDLGEYIALLSDDGSDTATPSAPLTLRSHIEFDLDPKTLKTLAARASAKGGFAIKVAGSTDPAILEERFSGNTFLYLTK